MKQSENYSTLAWPHGRQCGKITKQFTALRFFEEQKRVSNGNLENSENIQSPQSAVRGGAGEMLGKEHYAN